MRIDRILSTLFLVGGLVASRAAAEDSGTDKGFKPHQFVEAIFIVDKWVPSYDPRIGCITTTEGTCTGWLLSNGAFLTAGHCARSKKLNNCRALEHIDFSDPVDRPLEQEKNRYPIFSVQCRETSSGSYHRDWALFEVGVNKLGQFPIENQRSFFRPTAQADFPPEKISSVRVTGFDGVDDQRCGLKTATGEFLGTFRPFLNSQGIFNLRFLVLLTHGTSGGPVFLNGTSLALGIADGGGIVDGGVTDKYSYATSLQDSELAEALHAFPGNFLNPVIRGEDIFYVDYEAPFALKPTGNFFKPFPTLTEAFNLIKALGPKKDTIISVVTGSYPEKMRQNEVKSGGNPADITIILPKDAVLNLELPVGSVTIWGKAGAPPK